MQMELFQLTNLIFLMVIFLFIIKNILQVNPPVHAWAVWRVYKMTGPEGKRDTTFLARAFQKLVINFTW